MKHVATTAQLEACLPDEVLPRQERAAEILRFSVEGRRQISEAILNPPNPTAALRKAIKRRRELFGAE